MRPKKPENFEWTPERERAACLIAADELTYDEIASETGINRATLFRWKKEPAFAERVRALSAEMEDAARRYAIGRRERRVMDYDERRRRMLQVIRERAADPGMLTVPGGPTGLLVRSIKSVGAGPSAQIVEEYTVDTGLLKELRELEKQAAMDLGQWTEKREHSIPDLDALIAAELQRLAGGGQGTPAQPPPGHANPTSTGG